MNIIFPLFLLAASFMAQAAQTPPEYDPDNLVCPGKCVGSYTNTEFANNNCFGTIGSCVCIGTLTKPPLGNLTACLEGTTCSMSADDARTYIDGLLKFEGCSSSAQSAFEASSTAGGQGATGAGDSTAPPQASQSHNAGWTYMVASHGGGWALGVALVGLGTVEELLSTNSTPRNISNGKGYPLCILLRCAHGGTETKSRAETHRRKIEARRKSNDESMQAQTGYASRRRSVLATNRTKYILRSKSYMINQFRRITALPIERTTNRPRSTAEIKTNDPRTAVAASSPVCPGWM
ncbi:hypothetical protein C8J57DRAFT_1247621 [Mycena rebaudengoi]|nr:hypothetical protein C8J57DRAFT_1247621 [Mycena rebaudengoi]